MKRRILLARANEVAEIGWSNASKSGFYFFPGQGKGMHMSYHKDGRHHAKLNVPKAQAEALIPTQQPLLGTLSECAAIGGSILLPADLVWKTADPGERHAVVFEYRPDLATGDRLEVNVFVSPANREAESLRAIGVPYPNVSEFTKTYPISSFPNLVAVAQLIYHHEKW